MYIDDDPHSAFVQSYVISHAKRYNGGVVIPEALHGSLPARQIPLRPQSCLGMTLLYYYLSTTEMPGRRAEAARA